MCEAHAKSSIMYDYPVTLNTLANVSSMSHNASSRKFEMVGRTSLNHRTVKMVGSCMHRNEYLLVYIYSTIIYIYEETHSTNGELLLEL